MATAANDIIRAVLGYTYTSGGKPMSTVWHLRDTGGGGVTDADFINEFGLLVEGILVDMVAVQSGALFFTNITLQNITQNLLIATLVWPTFTVGGSANPINPSQVAGLTRMLTTKPRVQGRMFLPGTVETATTNSEFALATQLALASVGVNLLIPLAIGGGELTYVVFNQTLLTSLIPTSTAIGVNTRGLNRRKLD